MIFPSLFDGENRWRTASRGQVIGIRQLAIRGLNERPSSSLWSAGTSALTPEFRDRISSYDISNR
jgi:hypothetical protein